MFVEYFATLIYAIVEVIIAYYQDECFKVEIIINDIVKLNMKPY